MGDPEFVFRICSAEEWEGAQKAGEFGGADLDRQSGFIHLSTLPQVGPTPPAWDASCLS